MKIIIDADACPKSAFQICKRLCRQHSIELWTVASFNHNIDSDNHITVDGSSQAADIKIMNTVSCNDIVITQDWGLAAMILSKGAKCISPLGKEFNNGTIDFLLDERETKAKLRRGGARTKGPSKRSSEDDLRFEKTLISILENI